MVDILIALLVKNSQKIDIVFMVPTTHTSKPISPLNTTFYSVLKRPHSEWYLGFASCNCMVCFEWFHFQERAKTYISAGGSSPALLN